MHTVALGHSHREGILHAGLRLDTYRMAHAHAGAEIRICETLGSSSLHEGTHDRVAARIPSGRNHRHTSRSLGGGIERAAQVDNRGVDVKAVDSIDAELEILKGIFLDLACRSTEDSHIYISELTDVCHNLVGGQFGRDVTYMTAHDARNLKIGSCLESLDSEMSDIAVADYGRTYLFHNWGWG